jgi:hypothetical protein
VPPGAGPGALARRRGTCIAPNLALIVYIRQACQIYRNTHGGSRETFDGMLLRLTESLIQADMGIHIMEIRTVVQMSWGVYDRSGHMGRSGTTSVEGDA